VKSDYMQLTRSGAFILGLAWGLIVAQLVYSTAK
jgi:hypothetical protein